MVIIVGTARPEQGPPLRPGRTLGCRSARARFAADRPRDARPPGSCLPARNGQEVRTEWTAAFAFRPAGAGHALCHDLDRQGQLGRTIAFADPSARHPRRVGPADAGSCIGIAPCPRTVACALQSAISASTQTPALATKCASVWPTKSSGTVCSGFGGGCRAKSAVRAG
jgi:hypothetical protein